MVLEQREKITFGFMAVISVGFQRIKYILDILVIILFLILSPIFIYLIPFPPIQLITGTIFIFFAPGYSFLAAIYPSRKEFSLGQHIFASIGISVVLVGLSSLASVYIFDFTKDTAFTVILIIILLFSIFAIYQRSKYRDPQIYSPMSILQQNLLKKIYRLWKWLLLPEYFVLVLLVIAFCTYLGNSINHGPKFSEFYILGSDSNLANYPIEVLIGDPLTTQIGVINHTHKVMPYTVYYCIESECSIIKNITLRQGENWISYLEIPLDMMPGVHKITFVLAEEDQQMKDSYELHLWIQVVDRPIGILHTSTQSSTV
jgi:uncharacterized membrane protein